VHNGKDQSDNQNAPLPHVHYAPVTIKGITTTTPVDANSKKKVRLAEVRQKRVEAKIKRKTERDAGGVAKKQKPKKEAQKTSSSDKKKRV
jgi:hypothetical protein